MVFGLGCNHSRIGTREVTLYLRYDKTVDSSATEKSDVLHRQNSNRQELVFLGWSIDHIICHHSTGTLVHKKSSYNMKFSSGLALIFAASCVAGSAEAVGFCVSSVATLAVVLVRPAIVEGAGNATGAPGGGRGRRRSRADANLDEANDDEEDEGWAVPAIGRARRVCMEMPSICRPMKKRRKGSRESSSFFRHLSEMEKGKFEIDRVFFRGMLMAGFGWADQLKDLVREREYQTRVDQGRHMLDNYMKTEERRVKDLWKERYGTSDADADTTWGALAPSVRAKREAELKEDLETLAALLEDQFSRMGPDFEDEPEDDDTSGGMGGGGPDGGGDGGMGGAGITA